MVKWVFFGVGCFAMACTILGWCCVRAGALAEQDFYEYGE